MDRICSVLAALGLLMTVPEKWMLPAVFALLFLVFNASAGIEDFFRHRVQFLNIKTEKQKPGE